MPSNVTGVWEVLNQIWGLEKVSYYLKKCTQTTCLTNVVTF